MQDSGFQVLLQGNNFLRILQGLGVTIGISIVSVLLSLLLGTLFGIVMTSKSKIIRFLSRIYLEFIRIMPQLVLLFIVYFGLARNFNINISGELSAIIVFTLWGTAEMGDLVRGSITSLPRHQFESGRALGLTNGQLYTYVIIPQVLRRLLPQAINLVTRMIKTTSLVVLIGVVEVTKVGQQIRIKLFRADKATGEIDFEYLPSEYDLIEKTSKTGRGKSGRKRRREDDKRSHPSKEKGYRDKKDKKSKKGKSQKAFYKELVKKGAKHGKGRRKGRRAK